NRPSVLPQQRTDAQCAAAALIQVCFKMTGHLFNPVFKNHASEMSRAHNSSAGSQYHFAATCQHVSSHIVEVWPCYISGPSDDNIICRVCAIAAGSVCAKKIIPSIAILQVCGFTVNGNINGFIPFHAFSCLWIEFYEANEPEVGSVTTP